MRIKDKRTQSHHWNLTQHKRFKVWKIGLPIRSLSKPMGLRIHSKPNSNAQIQNSQSSKVGNPTAWCWARWTYSSGHVVEQMTVRLQIWWRKIWLTSSITIASWIPKWKTIRPLKRNAYRNFKTTLRTKCRRWTLSYREKSRQKQVPSRKRKPNRSQWRRNKRRSWSQAQPNCRRSQKAQWAISKHSAPWWTESHESCRTQRVLWSICQVLRKVRKYSSLNTTRASDLRWHCTSILNGTSQ